MHISHEKNDKNDRKIENRNDANIVRRVTL